MGNQISPLSFLISAEVKRWTLFTFLSLVFSFPSPARRKMGGFHSATTTTTTTATTTTTTTTKTVAMPIFFSKPLLRFAVILSLYFPSYLIKYSLLPHEIALIIVKMYYQIPCTCYLSKRRINLVMII